jgi:hypothetical protein
VGLQPNLLAVLSLWLFLPLALLVFRLLPGPLAATVLLLGGEMFLPADGAVDLPGLPALDKDLIVYTSVLICMAVYQRRRLAAARPGTSLELLGVVMAIGGAITAVLNSDTLRYGPTVIEGIPLDEVPTGVIADLLTYLPAFILGRALHRDVKDLQRLFAVLAMAGLVYSLFAWVEIWFSPQMHLWVYGFMHFSFDQTWRWGGYRPVIFMRNGLAYAIFMVTTFVAAMTLARARLPVFQFPARIVAPYLLWLVVLTRSLASMVLGAISAPLVWLARPRTIARVAVVLALFVTTYPLLRLSGWVPVEKITELFQSVDATRAKSLGGRFDVELKMVEKARERFAFGWSGYSRNWIFDDRTGDRAVIPDGHWVLILGSRGLVGFLSDFGLLVIPILVAARRLRRVQDRQAQILLAGLALIIALRLVDLIPNGRWTSLPTFLAGALYSSALALSKEQRVKDVVADTTPPLPTPLEPEPVLANTGLTEEPREKKKPRRMSDTLRRRPEGSG